jgi:hypothetical protein
MFIHRLILIVLLGVSPHWLSAGESEIDGNPLHSPTSVLSDGTDNSFTYELPRSNDTESASSIEEFNDEGKKRFRLTTNHYEIIASQPEEANLAGERLEHLLSVWQSLAAEVMNVTKDEPSQHHQVIIYNNKDEYTLNLQHIDPFIDTTNGYYFAPTMTAYFFSPISKVLFHEGTHQIFVERFFPGKKPVFHNNFWVAEGIALFMETLQVEEHCYKIGNILDDRLYAAKVYQFERNYHLPIRNLTAMSAAEIQASKEMVRIYSQSAALVHWLMFAEEGRYRRSLFELLRQTYLDTAKPETLSELTGLTFEELDKNYVDFLKSIPSEEK